MPAPRTHALDNLRTSLTALVILHHVSVPYGGAGMWLYTTPLYSPFSSALLITFNILNQTFFMGSFFLISAYLSSSSAQQRTRRSFLIEKMRRLGVPTLIYSVCGRGVVRGVLAARRGDMGGRGIWGEVIKGVESVRGVNGAVWYTALLLIFDTVYIIIRPSHFAQDGRTTTDKPSKAASGPEHFQTGYVLLALSATSISSFLVRCWFPVGTVLWPIGLQLAFLPQYLLYYTTGIFIHRSGRTLHSSISWHTLQLVGGITVVITATGLAQITSLLSAGAPFSVLFLMASGGMNLLALLYAFFNEFAGLLLGSLLLETFHCNNPRLAFLGRKWTVGGVGLAKYSYAAFLVHTPLVVDLQALFGKKGWEGDGGRMGGIATSATVGALAVVESWVVGAVVKGGVEWVGWRGYV
jgi:glucan biosynthesis protein C